MSLYDAVCRHLRRVGPAHDGGRPVLRRARARGRRPDRRARGRERARRDPGRARDRPEGDRDRPLAGDARSGARAGAGGRRRRSSSTKATCATSSSRSRRRSSTARSAPCSTSRRGPTGAGSSSASPRHCGPAVASRGTSFVFDPQIAASYDGRLRRARRTARPRSRPSTTRPTAGSTSRPTPSSRQRRAPLSFWWIDARRMGRPDRRRRPRGGGAVRRVRAAAVRRGQRRVRLGREKAGMSRQAAPNPLLPTRVGSLVPPATQRQRNPRKCTPL